MTFSCEEHAFRANRFPPYVLGTIAEKVMQARIEGIDVVDLSQMNPSTKLPARALDKLIQATLLPHNHRYSSSQGIAKLRWSVVSWYDRRFGVALDADREVVVTMGIKEGIGHMLMALLIEGDTAIVLTPSYPIHAASVLLAGGNIIEVPFLLGADLADGAKGKPLVMSGDSDAFFASLASAFEKTWPRPKFILLNFPHNPTGTVATVEFFERLVDFAVRNALYVIHDFAYADICFDGYKAPSIMQVKGASEVAVEFYSLSKGYGLTGWRVGFCVGNCELVGALKKVKSYLDFGIFQPLQIAAIEVLKEETDRHVAEVVSEYGHRRDVLVDNLNSIGWEVTRPLGSTFVWAPIPTKWATEAGSRSFSERLLSDARVAVCPGVGFSAASDNFVRFALVASEDRIRRAVSEIGRVFGGK